MAAQQQPEPIAIVGSACRFPGGVNSPSALWDLLQSPRDLSQEIPKDRFNTTGFYHPDGSHHGSTNVRHAYLLEEDVRVFDAAFFNISPNEADSIDPQQRLLMETVYEALERGGHTLDTLRGSDTAVFTGTMSVDYFDTGVRDLATIPTYFATGTNRAIISNRISYVFDWHGPSMTIDTACSSSLIAVHQAAKAIRTGESRVAVACGTQVILNPETFIFESKLNMLSPTGRSRMWDADADGYARGEGVAAVVLKRLSDAIADGDHIESIIRETGTNQDGHTSGITVPSTEAQAALIRKTYARAGLDPENNPHDRPQFFEAHGTGTKAGDPKEAAAIYQSFGQHQTDGTPLYVGSVKTVIGHLEGTAGLAGLLKASASIQQGFIPPNLLFNRLNPSIEPFYHGLQVATKLAPWPELPEGVPRRASVNSFGFGGSNAHAILEQYRGDTLSTGADIAEPQAVFTPFVFSAASEASLVAQLQAYAAHLQLHADDINAADLAWTLNTRRTQFSTRAAFSAPTIQHLADRIDEKLATLAANPGSSVGIRPATKPAATGPRIMGVFTGQGAQWAAMGAELIRSSPFVRQIVADLDTSLATLPPADRPQWTIYDEMLAGADTSRIAEAALSQPLCTALQIILVDLLKTAGISFSSVVGHSSGEIGAAYAAGFLSAHDAIRVAYYRGLYAHLAGNNNQKGAMLAAGISWEDAQEFVNRDAFKGRLTIAAHNSSASVTLSGDADAAVLAQKTLQEEKKFARLLKVDTAYHSHHMLPCADPYISALQTSGVQINPERDTSVAWFSSVVPSAQPVDETMEGLKDVYWKDNMTNAVLFADAVHNALAADDQIDLVLEVGPHPALKGPASQNIADVRPTAALPYSGVLSRGQNDVQAFADALGFLWTNLGSQNVDLHSYQTAAASPARAPQLVTGLPTYQWNHGRIHWSESRRSRRLRERPQATHEILGTLLPESTPRDLRWSNVLKPSEIPWLSGHQLQGQPVFPAAGYVAMALEGARHLVAGKPVELFELHDLALPRAITFEDGDNAAVETLVTLTKIQRQGEETVTAEFCCYSVPVSSSGSGQEMELMATASVKIVLGTPSVDALASTPIEDYNMFEADMDEFYESLETVGYNYTGPFRTLTAGKRRLGRTLGRIASYVYEDDQDRDSVYLIHPSTLDVAFQASILAYSAPSDDHLWSLHVPTAIGSLRVNPAVCASVPIFGAQVPVSVVLNDDPESFSACIDLFSEDEQHGMIQVEDIVMKPFAPATENDDRIVFTHSKFDLANPSGAAAMAGATPSAYEVSLGEVCERLSYYYVRKWNSELTETDWTTSQLPHFVHLYNWVKHVLSTSAAGKHPTVKNEWAADGPEDIQALIQPFADETDVKMLQAVGENLPASVRGETTILEHMMEDNLLDNHYKRTLGVKVANEFLARMMKQITHRYPRAKILEIGAGTGGATKSVLESIGDKLKSYTYTDVSVGFFSHAEALFKAHSHRMTFKTLDIEKPPEPQGYALHSYDIIVASNVLHATASLQTTLSHARQLLKPGGYLLLLELTNPDFLRSSTVFGALPGWWFGVEDGRPLTPIVSPREWHTVLRKSGFGGIETMTPELDTLTWPASVIVSQAVDDRVQFLRRPLSSSSSSVFMDSLVIMGNQTMATARIAEELSDLLERFCGQLTVLDGLPTESDARFLNPMSTFINLVDIDSPIFDGINETNMEGLKRVADLAKHVLWITQDALVSQPYHMASIAFSRVLRSESPHVSFNHLDVSDVNQHSTARSIAEHLLRSYALDEWKTGASDQPELLWSSEQETFLVDGQLKLPRLMANDDKNSRVNALRRVVTHETPVSRAVVSVWPSSTGVSATLLDQGPLVDRNHQQASAIRTESSSLVALRVDSDQFLYLAVGREASHEKKVVLLSTTNTLQPSPVAVVEVSESAPSADELLVTVASELLAESLIRSLTKGSHLLVHGSSRDRLFAAALSRHAESRDLRVSFSYNIDTNDSQPDQAWIGLSARTPRHAISQVLRRLSASHFLDLTTALSGDVASPLSIRIAQALPFGSKQLATSDLFQREASVSKSSGADALVHRLEAAVSVATSSSLPTVVELVIPLEQISSPSTPYHITTAVQWPSSGLVKSQVRPVDYRNLFSKDKTYLLMGLSGHIGRSLCEWMISNGAGCVCLTSRNPNVDPRWIQSVQETGATVRVLAMDVTNRESVQKGVREIRATCPPVGGVAHGAMVLHDSLFTGMSTSKMQEILGPKVDGANHLEEAFHDDELEFFVMFSSVSSIFGNAGQSLYVAGNGYLNGLARQRRRRGLAASTLDIGRVAGIGYIEQAARIVRDQLVGHGVTALSESDLRHAFAETIVAGFPTAEDKDSLPEAIVSTGVRHYSEDENIKGPWFTNPYFSHLIKDKDNAEVDSGDKDSKASLPVAQQVARATTKDEILEVLLDCFSARLRAILQLGDQEIDHAAPLIDLGIDSLVAVEVRSWFLKELKVDIPVLKVVGGASPAELCQRALDKLPEDLLANVGKPQDGPEKVQEQKPKIKLPVELQAQLGAQQPVAKSGSAHHATTGSSSADTPVSPATLASSAATSPPQSSTPEKNSRDASPALRAVSPSEAPPVVPNLPSKIVKSVPLSFGQSRFWFLHRLLANQLTHNVAYYYHITGTLRVNDLERATRLVAARHESLRTAFVADENDSAQAHQKVLAHSPVQLEYKKISSVEELAIEYTKLRRSDIDMASGKLLRVMLLSLSPSSHYLAMYHHHIIMDGVSLQVFLADLEKAYNGKPLGPSPRQYPEFSVDQRKAYENGEMNEELTFWQGIFPPGEEPPVLPLLPMARTSSRAPMKIFDTHQVEFHLSPEVTSRVRAVSKAQRSTPFHVYLAAFKAMLFAFTDAQDVVIGVADAARNEADLMGSMGFFLNLLPLRFRRQVDQAFSDAIVEARKTSYDALGNSRLPFDVLLTELRVTRSSSYSPFFQAFIDYRQGAQEKQTFGNCQMELQRLDTGKTAYDITVDVTDSPTDPLIMIRAQKSLYDLTAANLLAETYAHFLDVLTSDPSLTVGATPLFSEDQRLQAAQVGRGPKLVSEWPGTLPHRIDQVAQEQGDKVALMDGTGVSLTYTEMINRIQAIAEALVSAGVGPGSRVPVFEQATADWVTSMLAIMRVGAIYVPLDLRNPLPRLAVVAQNCEPAAILVDLTTVNDVTELGVDNARVINVSELGPSASSAVPNVARPDSPAAILYTSGSTGAPKGIVVTHSGLRNEIEGYTKMWGLKAERVLQQSAFTFNHSSDQIYTGLSNGGMVYIVPWSQRGNPLEITQVIRKHGITYTKATPSEYLAWMQYGGNALREASSWRFAFGGGEPLTTTVTQQFANLGLEQLQVFNSYGPTEISISSTKMEIPYRDLQVLEEMGRIPCGYSLPNYNTYIVDEQLRPVPVGMPGEVCLGGAGVSRGYFKNKELTDKHFVPNPLASPDDIANGWTMLYRAGDIGHLTENGELVFHNRMEGDTQVKIRGLRIELGDIESNIVQTSEGVLNEAVVTLREGDPELLVAHVTFAPNHSITDKDAFLDRLLSALPVPQYMVPVVAIPLDTLPLTNHSKVDRKAVKAMPLPARAQSTYNTTAELTESMAQLSSVWREVLGASVQALGLDILPSTNFFQIGGNSLLVIRLQERIRRSFNVAIPLTDLLSANTLAEMARLIEKTSVATPINWEEETAPPSIPKFLTGVAATRQENASKTVLLTGGTGFLARSLLPQLEKRPDVGTIHCVAVRDNAGKAPRQLFDSPKVIYHPGDLSSPLLGLSESEFRTLSKEVNVILHLGGARAFWDSYNVLRSSSVLSTKELIKLAAPRHIPIHYISTVGVLADSPLGEAAGSAAAHIPPADDANGYIATRWASERVLERSHDTLGVPSTVYRFLPGTQQAQLPEALMEEFSRCIDAAGVIPDVTDWEGRVDMVAAEDVVAWLSQSLLRGDQADAAPQFIHYESRVTVTLSDLAKLVEQVAGDRQLERIPVIRWFGRIKAHGFKYMLTSHETTVGGSEGGLISRR